MKSIQKLRISGIKCINLQFQLQFELHKKYMIEKCKDNFF